MNSKGLFITLAGRAGDRLDLGAVAGIELLAVPLGQPRLVVERVHLAGAAVHEQLDDALDLGPMVQAAVQIVRRRVPLPRGKSPRAEQCASASAPKPPPTCSSMFRREMFC